MIITRYTVILLIAYYGLHKVSARRNNRYSILQDKSEHVAIDSYPFRYWPQDSAGLQNMDSICPKGYTCLPNYVNPPTKRQAPDDDFYRPIKNTRFSGMAYSSITAPGGGCLGLEEFEEVGIQSYETGKYLGSCLNCIESEYKNTPMVYSEFNNSNSKWKMIPQNGRCAIKNIKTGKYLSRCKNCMSPTRNVSIVALFRDTIDDNTNDDLWVVTRRVNKTYTFKSASTGEYLGVCEGCGTKKSTIKSPAGLFTTSPDLSIVIWSVNIKPESATRSRFYS